MLSDIARWGTSQGRMTMTCYYVCRASAVRLFHSWFWTLFWLSVVDGKYLTDVLKTWLTSILILALSSTRYCHDLHSLVYQLWRPIFVDEYILCERKCHFWSAKLNFLFKTILYLMSNNLLWFLCWFVGFILVLYYSKTRLVSLISPICLQITLLT